MIEVVSAVGEQYFVLILFFGYYSSSNNWLRPTKKS